MVERNYPWILSPQFESDYRILLSAIQHNGLLEEKYTEAILKCLDIAIRVNITGRKAYFWVPSERILQELDSPLVNKLEHTIRSAPCYPYIERTTSEELCYFFIKDPREQLSLYPSILSPQFVISYTDLLYASVDMGLMTTAEAKTCEDNIHEASVRANYPVDSVPHRIWVPNDKFIERFTQRTHGRADADHRLKLISTIQSATSEAQGKHPYVAFIPGDFVPFVNSVQTQTTAPTILPTPVPTLASTLAKTEVEPVKLTDAYVVIVHDTKKDRTLQLYASLEDGAIATFKELVKHGRPTTISVNSLEVQTLKPVT
jgi:hypothetical protein